MLHLYDSLEGEIRELKGREPGRISMYLCGPTVYDLPHMGHGRMNLVWDVLRRWLSFEGFDVDFVSNITDIDDNIIKRAQRDGLTEQEVATTYEGTWFDAMRLLGVARPTHVPHATQYVEHMVELIEDFLDKDIAYRTSDGVYFDVSTVTDYGRLAGQPLDSLRAGARVETNDEKRSPLDFALWKNAKPGEPTWPAPFGEGRPGWHTECVVMSLGLLGEGFDFHGGGLDLKFPHHENERAQAIANGQEFARHWGHNGWVVVDGEKMSKSLNNFTSLTDLLAKTDARAYRLLVIRSHYRSPIEVTADTIADAERALARLDALARRFTLPELAGDVIETSHAHLENEIAGSLYESFRTHLDNDLDTPKAVAVIFEALSQANAWADEGRDDDAQALALAIATLLGALGLSVVAKGEEIDEVCAGLVTQRDAARAQKDWPAADRFRDELVALGWTVEDSSTGTVIRKM